MKKVRLFLIDIDPHFLERACAVSVLHAGRRSHWLRYGRSAGLAPDRAQARRTASCWAWRRSAATALALLRMLRAIPSQPALIVCTSFPSDTAMQMCREIGADMFLSKPVPLEQLHECIVDTRRTKRQLCAEQRALEAGARRSRPPRAAHALLLARASRRGCSAFPVWRRRSIACTQDERALRNLRRNLYPQRGADAVTTPENVERNMRTAIHHARGEAISPA